MLYDRPLLFIHSKYSSFHALAPKSPSVSLSLPPAWQPQVWFFMSVSLFLYFFSFIFNRRVLLVQYCVGFCHTAWIGHVSTWAAAAAPLPAPSHLSAVTGHSVEALMLYSLAARSLSLLHVVAYLWQWYSVNLSHLLLPLLGPRSLCLHLYSCPTNRFISTIFLDSVYMCWYTKFVFLFLISICITGSRFSHLTGTDSVVFLFYGWVIFHCVYVPQLLYPVICLWSSRLLPCPS